MNALLELLGGFATVLSPSNLLFALIGVHIYLVTRLGVTSPPWSNGFARLLPWSSWITCRRTDQSTAC